VGQLSLVLRILCRLIFDSSGNVGLGLWIAQGIVKLHQVCAYRREIYYHIGVDQDSMKLQGTFNLYSDGIEHGCRVVAELPLYAYPITPVSLEDQLKFADIFRAMESFYFGEVGFGDEIYGEEETTNVEISSSHAFLGLLDDDGKSEAVASSTQFVVPEMDRAAVYNIADHSQFQDIPFLEDISDQEVCKAAYDKDRSSSKGAHVLFSAHSKVHPGAPMDSSNGQDWDERSSSEVKVKPPSESSVVAAGEGPKKPRNGLRLLIVVSSLHVLCTPTIVRY